MVKLPFVIYILMAPVLMGVFVTALLTMDLHRFDGMALAGAAVAGAVAALPVSWFIARRLERLR